MHASRGVGLILLDNHFPRRRDWNRSVHECFAAAKYDCSGGCNARH